MTLADQRKARIEQIRASIKKAKKEGKELNIDKLLALCQIEWGLSRRTALEYLKLIEIVDGPLN